MLVSDCIARTNQRELLKQFLKPCENILWGQSIQLRYGTNTDKSKNKTFSSDGLTSTSKPKPRLDFFYSCSFA